MRLRDLQHLVGLLLVLDQREGDLRVLEDVDQLVGNRILIERHRDAADRLGGDHRCIEARPVLADQREVLAAAESFCEQPGGDGLDLVTQRRQLMACQMPRSFSRSAGASGRAAACASSNLGNVVPSSARSMVEEAFVMSPCRDRDCRGGHCPCRARQDEGPAARRPSSPTLCGRLPANRDHR